MPEARIRPQYSNTPSGALRQIRDCGWRSLVRNPAAFHRLPLHDYTHPPGGGRYARGIFRVVRTLTDEDRTRITARCEELLDEHHKFPYDLFKINCESAAFHVSHDAHLATHKLSAQVRAMGCGARASLGSSDTPAPALPTALALRLFTLWVRLLCGLVRLHQWELREQPRVPGSPGEQRDRPRLLACMSARR